MTVIGHVLNVILLVVPHWYSNLYCKGTLWPQTSTTSLLFFWTKSLQLHQPFIDLIWQPCCVLFLRCFFSTHPVYAHTNIVCCQLCLIHLSSNDSRAKVAWSYLPSNRSSLAVEKKSDLFGGFFLVFDGWNELRPVMKTAHSESSFLITAQCLTCLLGEIDRI